MTFSPLITITGTKPRDPSQKRVHDRPNAKEHDIKTLTNPGKRGCNYCPLNNIKGVHKIKGKVKGRDIFIWAQSPGAKENNKRKELVGPSGKWLWYELKRVGITRDQCDIQNVVRCWPVDIQEDVWPPFKMRAPNKQEIKCCSIYSEQALEKSKAKLHLVFGQIAAAAVLRKEFRKDQRIFYSDALKGWVVYLDHPSYFIRQGYSAGDGKPANASLLRFRADLNKAKDLLKKNSLDRYGFLKEQNYIGVVHAEQSNSIYRKLKKKAKQGYRLIVDMEAGKVNSKGEADESGKTEALCAGFAYKPGTTYVFALRMPGTGISKRAYKTNLRNVSTLLSDPNVKVGFHYGISDTNAIKGQLGVTVKGYDYDTLLAAYFKDPNAKSYGLTKLAERHYPEFLDYKSIEGPDAFTPEYNQLLTQKKFIKWSLPQKVAYARTNNYLNLARLPWKKMILYNGADCHLEALIQKDTVKYVNQPLMQVYIDSAYILNRMEVDRRCQPLFDYRWHKKVEKLLLRREKQLRHQVKKMAGKYVYLPVKKDRPQWIKYLAREDKKPPVIKKKFSPTSPDHILWLLFDKLGYKFTPNKKGDKPNTRAHTLLTLGLKHKKANIVVMFRQTTKARGTYVKGYRTCADLNEGHLRTNWKNTSTGTGRLSSGKQKGVKHDNVINLQNVHGDKLLQCLLMSDSRWRKLYKYWLTHGDFTKHTWKKFSKLYVDLGFDFSQNELRELAEESGDKNLIRAFATKKMWYCKKCKTKHKSDPHVEVGHALTGWARERIMHDEHVRKLVKNMQFGLVYGLQGEGLYSYITALGVETTLEEVNRYHKKYFRRFPGVKRLQEYYRKFVEKYGYVKNVFGFRRKLKVEVEEQETDGKKHPFWGNQAINTPIQGASHQLLMMAIAALYRYPDKFKLLQFPTKEIHDALYFRIRLDRLFKAIKQGMWLMLEEPVRIVKEDFKLPKRVPLSSKPKAGFRFGVEIDFDDTIKDEVDFLNAWCKANKELENTYKLQLKEDLNTFLKRKQLEL